MGLDVLELGRAPKGRDAPVEFPQPAVQGRVPRSDVPDVALEVLHIDRVEADDGRVEADVGFGDVGAVVVRPGVLGEVGFGSVEGGEEGVQGAFVGGLGGGEAGFVDAVVDVVVGPFVRGFDFCLKMGGKEVDFGVLHRQDVVEFGVEHADDLAGLCVASV